MGSLRCLFLALFLIAAITTWARAADPELIVNVQNGDVAIASDGTTFSERELRALRKRIAADVAESPLRRSGGLRLAIRGPALAELESDVHAIDVDDARALERVTDRFVESYFEDVYGADLAEPIEWIVGREFRYAAGEAPASIVAIGSTGSIDGALDDLVVVGSHVELGSNARVTNRLITAGSTLTVPEGARVADHELRLTLPADLAAWSSNEWQAAEPTLAARIGWSLFGLLASFVLGMIYFRAAPAFSTRALERLSQRPWRALGLGVLNLLAVLPAALLLVLTGIGILLLPLYFMAVGLLLWIAYISTATWIGRRIVRTSPPWQPLLLGLAILFAVSWVPFAGPVASAVATTFGLGSTLQTLYERVRARRRPSQPAPPAAPEPKPLADSGEPPAEGAPTRA